MINGIMKISFFSLQTLNISQTPEKLNKKQPCMHNKRQSQRRYDTTVRRKQQAPTPETLEKVGYMTVLNVE